MRTILLACAVACLGASAVSAADYKDKMGVSYVVPGPFDDTPSPDGSRLRRFTTGVINTTDLP